MSDIPVILGMVFFSGFLALLFSAISGSVCERPYYINQTWETNSSNVDWWDRAGDIYDQMTFQHCKGIPTWFSFIVFVPIIMTAGYILIRLIRGGG